MLFWLPLYLSMSFNYSDYTISLMVSFYDVGAIIGGIFLGIGTDLMYTRRAPLTALCILLGSLA